jgi:arginyl-tRNA synthetase
MPTIEQLLRERVQRALGDAFGPDFVNEEPAVHRSEHSDFQADAALRLAKKLGKKPRDVATELLGKLDVADCCEPSEIAGPGFLNLKLTTEFIDQSLAEIARDERLGVARTTEPETVVVDYSGPNVAKEMHVGHVRSTFIGDSLARTLELLGHRVIRQNHLGDWGTPFGMLIENLLDRGMADGELAIFDFNPFYQEARSKFDSDPGFAERARLRVVSLQGGDEETLRLWQRLVRVSTTYFEDVYSRLGITLKNSDIRGESFYNSRLPEVAAELESLGIARVDDGALCAFPAGFTSREGTPLPLIIRKKDGGYGYQATDLAGLRYRLKDLVASRLLYVTGAPQQQHLSMVFAVGKQAGWFLEGARAEHIAFGSILGPDKKMFKTRSGDSVKLAELVDEAEQRARGEIEKRFPDLDAETVNKVARQIGVGALKYADLSSDRIKDYIFEWSRMLAFEGNTAGYSQYAHARICSIFRKAEREISDAPQGFKVEHTAERKLAVELLSFPDVVQRVGDALEPHKLCTQLFEISTRFASFYDACPVLKAPDAATLEARLALCALTRRVLERGLDLLGIEAPERM